MERHRQGGDARRRHGEEVETDARGGFSVDLEPGSYEVLAVTDPGRPPTAAPEAVLVEEGPSPRSR